MLGKKKKLERNDETYRWNDQVPVNKTEIRWTSWIKSNVNTISREYHFKSNIFEVTSIVCKYKVQCQIKLRYVECARTSEHDEQADIRNVWDKLWFRI